MLSQEEANEQMKRLVVHRRNLAHYLTQFSLYGEQNVALNVVNGIREERENINRIKDILRSSGINFEDHPDDNPSISSNWPATDSEQILDNRHPNKESASQTAILSTSLMNPFTDAASTTDSNWLVGRERQIRRMWDRLKAGGNLTIIGPSSRDKLAMLELIERECQQELGYGIEVYRLLLRSSITAKELQSELAYALGGPSAKSAQLMRLIRGKHIILLIDNIIQLDKGARGLEVRQWLRSISNTRVSSKVQLVVTSRLPLEEIFRDNPRDGSPFADTMRDTIILGPMNELEARHFVEVRLQATPFRIEGFQDLLAKHSLPEDLVRACQQRFDELLQNK